MLVPHVVMPPASNLALQSLPTDASRVGVVGGLSEVPLRPAFARLAILLWTSLPRALGDPPRRGCAGGTPADDTPAARSLRRGACAVAARFTTRALDFARGSGHARPTPRTCDRPANTPVTSTHLHLAENDLFFHSPHTPSSSTQVPQ